METKINNPMIGLWTEHEINGEYSDYRDSPPTSSEVSALVPGMIIIEMGTENCPRAHVLRYIFNSFSDGKAE